MTDVLIIGDTFRSPELRHEVPLGVPDPFVYLERDGVRHVYVGSMEVPRIRGIARDIVVHPLGGMTRLDWTARNPRKEALISCAGPAVNLIMAGALWAIFHEIGRAHV